MPHSTLDPHLLASLGIDPAAIGEHSRVPDAASDVGEGARLSDWVLAVTTSLRLALGDAGFSDARVRAAESVDAHVAVTRYQDVVKITLGAGEQVRIVADRPLDERDYDVDDADPSTVVVDVSKGPVAVLRADGSGLLIQPQRGVRPVIHEVVGRPHVIAPLVRSTAPLDEWIADCTDRWLASRVRDLAASEASWTTVAAIGLLSRHEEASPEAARAAAREFLRAPTALPQGLARTTREWFARRSADEIETIRDLAISEVELLSDLALDLRRREGSFDRDWRDDALRLCHGREEVDGVRELLRVVGADAPLHYALEALDDLGSDWVESVDSDLTIDDELLRRVARGDPSAWWGRVAHFSAD